jgi:hypothetical protein
MKFAVPVTAVFLFLYGCAAPAYTDIQPSQTVSVGDGVTVTPEIEWGKANLTGFSGTLWTVDGASLDALLFFVGIPGRPLIETKDIKAEPQTYEANMLPEDVTELTGANFGKLGYQQVKTSNLRPAPFGAAEGFRFDMTYTTGGGLEMKAMALACQRNGRLDLIVFTAPTEYYFAHFAPTVEQIFGSVQVAG